MGSGILSRSAWLAALAGVLLAVPSTRAQVFIGTGRAGNDRQLLPVYDKDHDGRLNTAERQAAYNAMRFQAGARNSRGWGAADAGVKLTPADVKSYPKDVSLYDPAALRTVFLEFEDADWEAKMEAFYRTDVDIPATATVNGKVYKDIGVHFRGNSSFSSVPTGYKRSIDLSFDFVDEKQKLYGHKTLNLLNANEDPTFLRGILALEIARGYFMAPKANLMRLVINGESWGLYENIEQFNDDMTHEWYGKGPDARWKVLGSASGGRGGLAYMGEEISMYRSAYEIKSKDDPEQWKALVAMIRILNNTPPERLEAALQGKLDIDGALKFLAVDNVLVNGDGYWAKGGDYAIYRDPKGVFHVLSHDVNEFFMASSGRGGSTSMSPFASEGDSSKALAYRLLDVPALRARYLKYVRDISEKWLDWKTLGPRVQAYAALARDDVFRDSKKLFYNEDFVAGVSEQPNYSSRISFRMFAQQRRTALDSFFARPQ